MSLQVLAKHRRTSRSRYWPACCMEILTCAFSFFGLRNGSHHISVCFGSNRKSRCPVTCPAFSVYSKTTSIWQCYDWSNLSLERAHVLLLPGKPLDKNERSSKERFITEFFGLFFNISEYCSISTYGRHLKSTTTCHCQSRVTCITRKSSAASFSRRY